MTEESFKILTVCAHFAGKAKGNSVVKLRDSAGDEESYVLPGHEYTTGQTFNLDASNMPTVDEFFHGKQREPPKKQFPYSKDGNQDQQTNLIRSSRELTAIVDDYFIFWDWDNTVVDDSMSRPEGQSPQLKKGILDYLERTTTTGLRGKAVKHFVTSSNTTKFIEEDATEAGIRKYFSGFFGRETVREEISSGAGKCYGKVIDSAGIQKTDASSKVIIIGDAMGDMPLDTDIIYVYEKYGCKANMDRIEEVINSLFDNGEGDFLAGFRRLYASGDVVSKSLSFELDCKGEVKKVDLNGFKVRLSYINSLETTGASLYEITRPKIIPTIYLVMD